MNLIRRLLRTELLPNWKALIMRFILAAIVASVPYGFSMLGRWLVDDVLAVAPVKKPKKSTKATSTTPNAEVANAVKPAVGESTKETVPAVKKKKKRKPVPTLKLESLGISIKLRAKSDAERYNLLLLFFVLSLSIHLVVTLIGILSEYLNSRLVHGMILNLRQQLHSKLYQLDSSVFGREQVGQLTTRVMDDTAAIPGNLVNLVVNAATQGVMLVLGLYLLFTLEFQLALMILVVFPLYAVICFIYLPKIRRNSEDIREKTASFKGFIIERLNSILTIKSYAKENHEITAFNGRLEENQSLVRTQQKLNLAFNTSRTLVKSLGTVAVLGVGFMQLKQGRMTLGEVLAFHQVAIQLFIPISALVGMGAVIQNLSIAASRVFKVIDAPLKLESGSLPVKASEMKGDISFKGVSISFHEKGPFALENIDLNIAAGQRVCLVGPTGCGKSTIISLISRLCDPDKGSVTIDGVDCRDYNLLQLRRSVGKVFHNTQIFNGTLAENISFGLPSISSNEIERVGHLVGLDDLARSLPMGYDSLLNSVASRLDRHHLARLSFARALIARPAILTVDDTFSALGEETEEELLNSLRDELGHCTWVIATSRLSICQNVDWVVAMDGGKIRQQGTHSDLISRNGLYKRLYLRQMGTAGR